MIDFSRVKNYYIRCGYTDMRKQIDGLVALVQLEYHQEMDEESLFLFCGRRSDRIKVLYWDGTGYVLLYKRLNEKRFQWPRNPEEWYRDENIDGLLMERHMAKVARRSAKHHLKGPAKRFEESFRRLIVQSEETQPDT